MCAEHVDDVSLHTYTHSHTYVTSNFFYLFINKSMHCSAYHIAHLNLQHQLSNASHDLTIIIIAAKIIERKMMQEQIKQSTYALRIKLVFKLSN